MTHFADTLTERARDLGTPCIVGLDPSLELMPEPFLREHGIGPDAPRAARASALASYCELIIDAVADLVPAVKPQIAYFERYGAPGIAALEAVIDAARRRGLLIILDAKRGDIGSTSAAYAQAYLEPSTAGPAEVDAMTLSPYLGDDSLEPFVEVCERAGKGVFVCVRTSNAGGDRLQSLDVGGRAVCDVVAAMLAPWADRTAGRHGYSGVGAVVGATYPEAADALRRSLPRSIFLVPGVGAQGGDATQLRAYFDRDGRGAVVSSSRAINYPHRFGPHGPGRDGIRQATVAFIEQVRAALR